MGAQTRGPSPLEGQSGRPDQGDRKELDHKGNTLIGAAFGVIFKGYHIDCSVIPVGINRVHL